MHLREWQSLWMVISSKSTIAAFAAWILAQLVFFALKMLQQEIFHDFYLVFVFKYLSQNRILCYFCEHFRSDFDVENIHVRI